MSTETNKPAISPEDFQPVDVEADPAKLRQLIEGLRALPNVSDMAVIAAIAELDRIAGLFELAARRREHIHEFVMQLAQQRGPQIAAIVGRGFITPDLMNEVIQQMTPPSPDCDCDRCRSHFGKPKLDASGKPHLNS